MNNQLPQILSKKKAKEIPLIDLLDQIERMKLAIENIQKGYEIYKQLRFQALGKHYSRLRELFLLQLHSLDSLHQSVQSNKGIQKDISNEFKNVFHSFEDFFTLSYDEIKKWKAIVLYHTGIHIDDEELTPIEIEVDEELPQNVTKKSTSDNEKKTIRSIYKDLMKFYHPDRNSNPNATIVAQEIIVSYEQGNLEHLLQVYKNTFSDFDGLDDEKKIRRKMEKELELLYVQFDEMVKQLGANQNMTEKIALKRVKVEAKKFREYIAYQEQLLNLIYCDIDLFKDYRKNKS